MNEHVHPTIASVLNAAVKPMSAPSTSSTSRLARELGRDPAEPGARRMAEALASDDIPDPISLLPQRFQEGANLVAGFNPSMRSLMASLVETAIAYGRIEGAEDMARRLGIDDPADAELCPKCHRPMDLIPAEPAQTSDDLPPGGIPATPAYWSCECGHNEKAEEPERFDEFTGPLD